MYKQDGTGSPATKEHARLGPAWHRPKGRKMENTEKQGTAAEDVLKLAQEEGQELTAKQVEEIDGGAARESFDNARRWKKSQ